MLRGFLVFYLLLLALLAVALLAPTWLLALLIGAGTGFVLPVDERLS